MGMRGQCWGAMECLLHHKGCVCACVCAQAKNPCTEAASLHREINQLGLCLLSFTLFPAWQPFKQWLWGNVPLWMSNNSQDQQVFFFFGSSYCYNKKRVQIILPGSTKDGPMRNTCKQEQKAAQTKVFCPEDAISKRPAETMCTVQPQFLPVAQCEMLLWS